MAKSSPTVARRTLARVLREARADKGVSSQVAAAHAGLHPSTLSRVERAEVKVEPGTAGLLLELYGVGAADRKVLLEVARAARQRGWWQRFRKAVPNWFNTYVGLETEARALRTYETELVPGILQRAEYARVLVELDALPPADDKEAERRVAVRLERQERVTGENPLSLSVILNEAVLYRQVGGPRVMVAQIEHLITMSRLANVEIQVLPFSVGGHPASYGSFVILEFPQVHDHTVVYIEYCGGSLYLEEQQELDTYNSMFTRLRMSAADEAESQALLRKALETHRR